MGQEEREENMNNNIIMIDVDNLIPHPDNPRKNLGDLTELSDSIREQGIFQNLTVVPAEDGKYTVIIGHRRLAAAKLAGLKKVPCAVVEMDEDTQFSTMLLENMQRSDLTVLEQADGIQQLQLRGFSLDEIRQKTGFSKSTITLRLKVAALPKKETREAYHHGATLADYIKVSELEHKTDQKELLKYVGNRDFEWKYNALLIEQNKRHNKPRIEEIIKKYKLKELSSNQRWSSNFEQIKSFIFSKETFDEESFVQTIEKNLQSTLLYYFEAYNIVLYEKIKKQKKENPRKSKAEIRADEARAALAEKFKTAYNLRKSFCDNFSDYKTYKTEINEHLLFFAAVWGSDYLGNYTEKIAKKVGCDNYVSSFNYEAIREKNSKIYHWCRKPEAAFIVCTALMNDSKDLTAVGYSWGKDMPTYQPNVKLEMIYVFLVSLGYQLSTEEQQLIDGTHELYGKDDTK